MNLLQSPNRPTWRDEVLAVPVVFVAIVVMIVLELGRRTCKLLKGKL